MTGARWKRSRGLREGDAGSWPLILPDDPDDHALNPYVVRASSTIGAMDGFAG